ncbi:argininosuccinate lyase [Arenibacterium sp. LLYu02]|uniref:argininosuccinate lyase n=1 Tax=Arenibacterium sp. LLYu02 TaxID=3404132 RepID=UPI003B218243
MTAHEPKDRFPAPRYRDTVLRPAFAGAKAHRGLMRQVDQAHLVMLAEQDIVPRDHARAILAAIEETDAALDLAELRDAGAHEDLFYLLEAELIARVGPEVGGCLHVGRSRNDLEATLFKLALKPALQQALSEMVDLCAALHSLAEREKATIVLAYTHGQPAQPTTLGHYLGSILECLLRHCDRMLAAYEVVDLCPLGAAAITTTGFPISRTRVAELLGFAAVQENSYGCIASVDYLTGCFSALKLALLDIGRLCQDLAFWCGFEVDQLRVSDGYVQVSSIMPQKRNPLALEHLRTMASLAAGQCETVISTVHNTPYADMVDAEAPTQQAGQAAFATFGRVMRLLVGVVEGLSVNPQSVARNIARSTATMTELADSLVRLEGVSFRTAHEITSRLARQMLEERLTMADLTVTLLGQVFEAEVGRPLRLQAAEVQRLTTPEHFVAVRDIFGGPGQSALSQSLAQYEDRLLQVRGQLDAYADAQARAEQKLAEAVAAL